MGAEERAFPFRYPEEAEHFELVDDIAADDMAWALGLQQEPGFTRQWMAFALSEGPSRTNKHDPSNKHPFDIEHMRHEAQRGRRRFVHTALTT